MVNFRELSQKQLTGALEKGNLDSPEVKGVTEKFGTAAILSASLTAAMGLVSPSHAQTTQERQSPAQTAATPNTAPHTVHHAAHHHVNHHKPVHHNPVHHVANPVRREAQTLKQAAPMKQEVASGPDVEIKNLQLGGTNVHGLYSKNNSRLYAVAGHPNRYAVVVNTPEGDVFYASKSLQRSMKHNPDELQSVMDMAVRDSLKEGKSLLPANLQGREEKLGLHVVRNQETGIATVISDAGLKGGLQKEGEEMESFKKAGFSDAGEYRCNPAPNFNPLETALENGMVASYVDGDMKRGNSAFDEARKILRQMSDGDYVHDLKKERNLAKSDIEQVF